METRKYQKEDLTIVWKPNICAHSGNCVRSLPGVFKPREKPWIQPEHASTDELKAAIDKCPSGALSYQVAATAPLLAQDGEVTIDVMPNGPVIVTGNCLVKTSSGEERPASGRVALCRCGHSSRKPYCDGSHRGAGFQAE